MRIDLVLWIIVGLAAIVFGASYICYCMAFFAPRKNINTEDFPIPPGEEYVPYRAQMIEWMRQVRAMPYEAVEVRSFDGLRLCGKYYEFAPDAPTELMFHGYRGSAERDLCGGVQRAFALGHSVLLIDQRTSGGSDGHTISFGINESLDCRTWIDFAVEHFGADVKLILTGISMGASTVMIAAGQDLPENVIGVLADCGYTSAKAIICKVIRGMHLPAGLLYPFVRLGARIFGHFRLEETSPVEAMRRCQVPVIFFHGEADNFVPCEMSRENYEACAARKKLVTVPGAGHGAAYLVDPERYIAVLKEFWRK